MSKNTNFEGNRKGAGDESLLPKKQDGATREPQQAGKPREDRPANEGIPIRPNISRQDERPERADRERAERPLMYDKAPQRDVSDRDDGRREPVTLKRNSPSFVQIENYLDEIRADFTEGSVAYVPCKDLNGITGL